MTSSSVGEFSGEHQIVFFDLETTGVKVKTAEITQLAAKIGEKTFSVFIMPKGPIPSEVTKITGFYIKETELKKQMYDRRGVLLVTVPLEMGLRSFLDFLREFQKTVVLVAHNCHGFDAPILLRSLREVNLLREFVGVVAKFSDTWPILEHNKMPMRWTKGKNYKLADLSKEFLGTSEGAHDATVDVERLEKLTLHPKINISYRDFISETLTPQEVVKMFGI